MMKSIRNRTKFILTPLALATFVISAPSQALPHATGHAFPPYHIKPNVTNLVPSGMTPMQITSAYHLTTLTNRGEGQIIGIVDAMDDPAIESDLGVFNTMFNLSACTTANGCFSKIYASGEKPPTDAGWSGEIALDVEWAHVVAPAAKIMLVEAASSGFDDLFKAVQVAVDKGANVVSMSWGGGEFATEMTYDSVFSVPNVTFTAAAGDNGTGILYPAASPNVVSVGGTSLTIDKTSNYVKEKAWSGSGGGVSQYETEPTYQKTFNIPHNAKAMRGVPDVSYNADPNTGFSVYDSVGSGGWAVVGGTSAGAPQWAALIATVNATRKTNLNATNQYLYQAASNNYAANYNDVSTGSNGLCLYYCKARKGYDYVTGIGSPKSNSLVVVLANSLLNNYYV